MIPESGEVANLTSGKSPLFPGLLRQELAAAKHSHGEHHTTVETEA